MMASLLITFREGLEAFLLVGILLAYLRKLDAMRHAKWIYVGVAAGVLASLALAVVMQVLVDQFDNERYQTLVMIGVLLFAAAMLSYVALWMQRQAREHVAGAKERLAGYVGTGNLLGMVSLSFVAVMREGLETVLFFSALVYSGQGVSMDEGLTGALIGLALSVLLVWLLLRGARKVALAPFFQWTSLLILIIAAGLLASAVNMMQSVAILDVWHQPLFDISWFLDDRGLLGTFLRALFGYNSSPTPLQFVVWLAYLAVAVGLWKKGYAKG